MEGVKENIGDKVDNAIGISLKTVLIFALRIEINLFVSQELVIH